MPRNNQANPAAGRRGGFCRAQGAALPIFDRRRGFTLVELLLSTILGAILVSVAALTFANLAGSFAEKPASNTDFDWDYNGGGAGNGKVPMSPAYSQLPAALSLQGEILHELQATVSAGVMSNLNGNGPVCAVYVLSGDEGALPDDDSAPATLEWLGSIPQALLGSSTQFSSAFASHVAGLSAQNGFSLYFISGLKTVNLVVHCRWVITADPVFGSILIYKVKTYSAGVFSPELSYEFGIVANADNSSVKPGVRRVAVRTNADWSIQDEIGSQVIFPDPTVLPYQIAAGDGANVRTYSRFAMLLPTQP